MLTLEALKQKLESTEDLQSVVKTMKELAAVNIRQYEKAVAALADYMKTVERGLQITLANRVGFAISARPAPQGKTGVIVFGSDQGMCGRLNEQIVSHTLAILDDLQADHRRRRFIAVGMRAMTRLEDADQQIQDVYAVPNAVRAIEPLVQNLLVEIDQWTSGTDVNDVLVFYCRQLSGATYRAHHVRLLPLDHNWLKTLREKKWPTNNRPTYTMSWDPLFSALIRQYLLVALFRAAAHSLASENASRLASMQGAERNIEEQLDALKRQYHQQRQMSITEELLDIVSGFQVLDSE